MDASLIKKIVEEVKSGDSYIISLSFSVELKE